MESDVKHLLELLLAERVIARARELRTEWVRNAAKDAGPPKGAHFVDEAIGELRDFAPRVIAAITPTDSPH